MEGGRQKEMENIARGMERWRGGWGRVEDGRDRMMESGRKESGDRGG